MPLVHHDECRRPAHGRRPRPASACMPATCASCGTSPARPAPAAYNVRLTADLRLSKERLVTAREEEWRRVRRELHDRLGPLDGILLGIVAASNTLARADVPATKTLLIRLKNDLRSEVADIRALVDRLRPRSLDELGLVGAVQRQAQLSALPPQPLVVTVEAGDLGAVPAGVEVAAYQIVSEALTNVRRHAIGPALPTSASPSTTDGSSWRSPTTAWGSPSELPRGRRPRLHAGAGVGARWQRQRRARAGGRNEGLRGDPGAAARERPADPGRRGRRQADHPQRPARPDQLPARRRHRGGRRGGDGGRGPAAVRPPAARRGDHGPAHARDGRHRGDQASAPGPARRGRARVLGEGRRPLGPGGDARRRPRLPAQGRRRGRHPPRHREGGGRKRRLRAVLRQPGGVVVRARPLQRPARRSRASPIGSSRCGRGSSRASTTPAIARELYVSDKWVRNCASQLYAKLGVAGRAGAISAGMEAGLGRKPGLES